MSNYQRINERVAKNRFNLGLPFVIIGCNCRPEGENSLAYHVSAETIAEWKEQAASYKENPLLWKGDINETAWDLFYRTWSHYNTGDELGDYGNYYIDRSPEGAK